MRETKVTALRRIRGARGAVMTEYAITVGLVGLVVAAALVARGDMLLLDYDNARDLVLVPAL